jgi:hypothetical protein
VGSRSAPIWIPTSGVFARDFSYLLQFGWGVTSARSDAGRFLSFANVTCALPLGEQLLGLPAIEFIGALAFHR